ncbi:MAG: hypothetical protein ACKO8G_02265 [Actinomycetota bacterium]
MSPRTPDPTGNGGRRTAPGRVPRLVALLQRPDADSPFPPAARSLVRGFLCTAASTPYLAAGLLLLPLLWFALVAVGLDGPFGRLVNLVALPPISTYVDSLNATSMFGYGAEGFAATTGFLLVRSFLVALLAGLAVAAVERSSPLLGLIRGLRAVPAALIGGLLGLGLMLVGSVVLPLLGPGLGFLGSVVTLIAALVLFTYGPIVAAHEGLPGPEAVRKGMRAALMPGSRHLHLCLTYFFLCLPILVAVAPDGSRLGVNPSVGVWTYALVATYLHLAFLAAFAYRYLAVAEVVPAPAPRRARQRPARGA